MEKVNCIHNLSLQKLIALQSQSCDMTNDKKSVAHCAMNQFAFQWNGSITNLGNDLERERTDKVECFDLG